MANRKKKVNRSAIKDLLTVAFAEDMDLARQYKELLAENDIPAVIKTNHQGINTFSSVAVLVPEEFLDEAHVLIQSHSSYGDFYDLAFDEMAYQDNFDQDRFDDDIEY